MKTNYFDLDLMVQNQLNKDVIFNQDLKPGMQSQSDYTVMNGLNITIAGEQFDHLLFHFQ